LYGAEADFDVHFVQSSVGQLDNLVEALLPDGGSRLLEQLVLTLDDRRADGTFARLVTLEALL
jgi:hypothetical protein